MALFPFLGDNKRLTNSREQEVLISPIPARHSFYQSIRFRDTGGLMNMNVDGSGTPRLFKITPPTSEIWFIEYITLFMEDTGTFGPEVFGSLGLVLTNGLALSQKSAGIIKEITLMKDNSDIFQCFFGAQASPQTGSTNGVFQSIDWLGGRMEFKSNIILDALKGDFMEFSIRDNLSDLGLLRASVLLKTTINT